ncbi:hypothetical protein HOY80DRAFT_872257, partial [Tuber brumale]
FNAKVSGIRCFRHVINLVVKGFLWGSDWAAFESNIHEETTSEEAAKSLKSLRSKGPMGKLYNIGTWILRT